MLQKSNDQSPQFVGQIEEYKEFFKKGVLSKKDEAKEPQTELNLRLGTRNKIVSMFVINDDSHF